MANHPKGIAPLCRVGREPGTRPPTTREKNKTREEIREDWTSQAPGALCVLLSARAIADAPLTTRVLLDLLLPCGTTDVPPIAKRQWLQNHGLVIAIGGGTWEVSEAGREAATHAAPFLDDATIREILART